MMRLIALLFLAFSPFIAFTQALYLESEIQVLTSYNRCIYDAARQHIEQASKLNKLKYSSQIRLLRKDSFAMIHQDISNSDSYGAVQVHMTLRSDEAKTNCEFVDWQLDSIEVFEKDEYRMNPIFNYKRYFDEFNMVVNSHWAFVKNEGMGWGYLNEDALLTIPMECEKISFHSFGCHCIKNDQAQIINENGIRSPEFDFISPTAPSLSTKEHYELRLTKVSKNGKVGLMDMYFKLYVPIEYDDIIVSRGRYIIGSKEGKRGLINPENGQPLSDFKYDYIQSSSSENVFYTTIRKDGKKYLGKLDMNGQEIGETRYITDPKVFIPYRSGDKWGLANPHGEVVFEPQFDYVTNASILEKFPEGNFLVKQDGKWGVIDSHKVVLPPTFKNIEYDVKSHFFWGIHEDGQRSLYNRNGLKIIEGNYSVVTEYYIARKLLYLLTNQQNYGDKALFWYDLNTRTVNEWIVKDCESLLLLPEYKGRYANEATLYYRKNGEKQEMIKILKFDESSSHFILQDLPVIDEDGIEMEEEMDVFEELESYELDINDDFSVPTRKEQVDTLYFYKLEKRKLFLDVFIKSGQSKDSFLTLSSPIKLKFKNAMTYRSKIANSQWKNYVIFEHKGKYGWLKEGEIMAAQFQSPPPVFTSSDNVYFLPKNEQGKSAVFLNSTMIQPFVYDSLLLLDNKYNPPTDSSHWLNWKDDKCGLMTIKEELIPCQYDLITEIGNGKRVYLLQDSGKYGYYGKGKYAGAIFDYQVSGYRYFIDYLVYELTSREGQFLGFGDPDGFYYFDE